MHTFTVPFNAWSENTPTAPENADPKDANATVIIQDATAQLFWGDPRVPVLTMMDIPIEAAQEEIHATVIRAYNTLIEERNEIRTVV